MKLRKLLSYGPPGGGKSALCVSSFWNFLENKPILKENGEPVVGRWIQIGAEVNDELDVPAEYIKHFSISPTAPLKFADDLGKYLRTLAAAKTQGKGVDALVLDGLTQFNVDYIYGHEKVDDKMFAAWRGFKERMTELTQLLNPNLLGCNIFATARVARFKGDRDLAGQEIQGDPDWLKGVEYIPNLDGYFRDQIGHYFSQIVYIHAETAKKGGKYQTVHKSQWLPGGDYLVKNQAEHKWLKAGRPMFLENVMWPEVQSILDNL